MEEKAWGTSKEVLEIKEKLLQLGRKHVHETAIPTVPSYPEGLTEELTCPRCPNRRHYHLPCPRQPAPWYWRIYGFLVKWKRRVQSVFRKMTKSLRQPMPARSEMLSLTEKQAIDALEMELFFKRKVS